MRLCKCGQDIEGTHACMWPTPTPPESQKKCGCGHGEKEHNWRGTGCRTDEVCGCPKFTPADPTAGKEEHDCKDPYDTCWKCWEGKYPTPPKEEEPKKGSPLKVLEAAKEFNASTPQLPEWKKELKQVLQKSWWVGERGKTEVPPVVEDALLTFISHLLQKESDPVKREEERRRGYIQGIQEGKARGAQQAREEIKKWAGENEHILYDYETDDKNKATLPHPTGLLNVKDLLAFLTSLEGDKQEDRALTN